MPILSLLQIILAVTLITSILLQQRGAALGSSFGGGGGASYSNQRGVQKKLYWGTIILGSSFLLLSLIQLAI